MIASESLEIVFFFKNHMFSNVSFLAQVTYTLGAAGHSYVVGYGCNPPLNPYHRDSTLTYEDMSETTFQRRKSFENRKQNANLLIGAVLGGPNYRDDWVDDRMDVPHNNVALDYNAALFLAAIQVTFLES